MKALKDIPFDKIYDGMKAELRDGKISLFCTVLKTCCTPSYMNWNPKTGEVNRGELENFIVFEYDDNFVVSVAHKRCGKIFFVE